MSDGTFVRVEEAFARRVTARADATAVWDATGTATYGELWEASARLARALRAGGVESGDAVCLRGVGDRDTITGMLGILRAGGHVVPVDPDCPAERVGRMAGLVRARLLLATGDHPVPPGVPVGVRHVRELLEFAPAGGPVAEPAGTAHDLAYTMFTSGSTGAPKPVGVPHGALTALCLRDSPVRRAPGDVVLAHTILTFDPSMLEIWSALLAGAALLCAPGHSRSVHETAALLTDPRVTTAVLTPAVFALVVERRPEALRSLRQLIVGGDVLPYEQALLARRECPGLEIVNCYGPTENTVVSTAFPLSRWDGSGPSVPIGTPVAGTTCLVLDADRLPVPDGEVGDLYLGGDRLATGYVGDPGGTRERFLPDPSVPGGRIYRTGDRAARLPGGDLAFHGREDDECKVRGFRVHLAEVESLTAADERVRAAAAVPVGEGHDRRVVVFVRTTTPDADPRAVRARTAERAPGHLVPAEVVPVDGFPLTESGKVDRAALAARYRDRRPTWSPGPAPGPGSEADTDPGEPEADDRAVLAELWRRHTGAPADAGHDFFSAGGTSLDLIRLVDDVGHRFGVLLDFVDVYGLASFDELVGLVAAARAAG
ncbi:amino acid adenylation domain-containing protein [Streptomyces sp. AJS327]|uniref:non-ribosomal peptide synthetase n=1 Tax=Streptomyces sp. AJS327 TaxID=2545265 RepID=UPI0015DE96DC|nr:non-ribosomal peptide synthetase [Streptomyces sp. AJS327]MBA0051200.1 amino acid adenylation domain-containing protein [Streptomyces sp. AJS327]